MKIPQGMHSVTPHLVCAGAANAIDFYKQAFGAQETARMPGPGGKLMHAAGFRVLEVSGGYHTRGRFFGNQSRHIIVLAERKDPAAA